MSPAEIRDYIRASDTVRQLKQVHAFFLKPFGAQIRDKQNQSDLVSCLLAKLVQLPGDNLDYAHKLFDKIPQRKNHFLWTSLLRSHVVVGRFSEAISLYARMHREGVPPCKFTFSLVLSACARLPALSEGRQTHARVLQSGFFGNKIVGTALLDMYGKNGVVSEARVVFNEMNVKDVVAWTAMVCGYSKVGMMDDARTLFDAMEQRNIVSWTTMVAGYANIGDMRLAEELYRKMPGKNTVTWIAMIAGYGKVGDVGKAREVFDEAEVKDAECRAAMVACYAQNGYAEEALRMYNEMRKEKSTITEVATVGAISAITQLADVAMANELADHVDEGSCNRTIFVSNALIHMHSKCGNFDRAYKEFNKMKSRDVISYSSLITAIADHGKTNEALNLFHEMLQEGIKPNQVTFVSVLSACSHAGLVEEGCRYFDMMTRAFSIKQLVEHCASLIDLLGRAGQLERAYELMVDCSGLHDAGVLGALLGACRIHGNVELAEPIARKLFEIEPENTGNYTLLANIYKSVNRWDDAENVRKLISSRGIRKSPGSSRI